MANEQQVSMELVGIVSSAVSVASWLTWWMGRQFSNNRRVFYQMMSRHNKEDDDRFSILDDSIWQINLRNAVRDGEQPPQRKNITRRRYLQEGEDADAGD